MSSNAENPSFNASGEPYCTTSQSDLDAIRRNSALTDLRSDVLPGVARAAFEGFDTLTGVRVGDTSSVPALISQYGAIFRMPLRTIPTPHMNCKVHSTVVHFDDAAKPQPHLVQGFLQDFTPGAWRVDADGCLLVNMPLKMRDGKTLRSTAGVGGWVLLDVPMFQYIKVEFFDDDESYTEEALIDSGFIVRGSRTTGKSKPHCAATYRSLDEEEARQVVDMCRALPEDTFWQVFEAADHAQPPRAARSAPVSAAAAAYPKSPQPASNARSPSGGSTQPDSAFSLDQQPKMKRVATSASAMEPVRSVPALAPVRVVKVISAGKVLHSAVIQALAPPSPTPMRVDLTLQVDGIEFDAFTPFAAAIAAGESLPAELSAYSVFSAHVAAAIDCGDVDETPSSTPQQGMTLQAASSTSWWLFSDNELSNWSREIDAGVVAPSMTVAPVTGVKRHRSSSIPSSHNNDIHDDVALFASPSKMARMLDSTNDTATLGYGRVC